MGMIIFVGLSAGIEDQNSSESDLKIKAAFAFGFDIFLSVALAVPT